MAVDPQYSQETTTQNKLNQIALNPDTALSRETLDPSFSVTGALKNHDQNLEHSSSLLQLRKLIVQNSDSLIETNELKRKRIGSIAENGVPMAVVSVSVNDNPVEGDTLMFTAAGTTYDSLMISSLDNAVGNPQNNIQRQNPQNTNNPQFQVQTTIPGTQVNSPSTTRQQTIEYASGDIRSFKTELRKKARRHINKRTDLTAEQKQNLRIKVDNLIEDINSARPYNPDPSINVRPDSSHAEVTVATAKLLRDFDTIVSHIEAGNTVTIDVTCDTGSCYSCQSYLAQFNFLLAEIFGQGTVQVRLSSGGLIEYDSSSLMRSLLYVTNSPNIESFFRNSGEGGFAFYTDLINNLNIIYSEYERIGAYRFDLEGLHYNLIRMG